MTCQACALTVEKAIARVPGVVEAAVNFGSRSAEVVLAEDGQEQDVQAAVRAAGYSLPRGPSGSRTLRDDVEFARRAEDTEQARLRRAAIGCGIGALWTWVASLSGLGFVVTAIGATVCQAFALRPIHAAGTRSLLKASPDMNTLVSLGSGAAWLAGMLAPVFPSVLPGGGAMHLRASTMILAFVLLGRWLEGRARERTGAALQDLLELTPPIAHVFRRGQEIDVPLEEVRPGNLILVRPGERIPVDGKVMEGKSEIDEALFSGEPIPQLRAPGDEVHAGTINGVGALSIQATSIGEDSTLGRITRSVHAAMGSRAPVQRLADRISAVFVPAVLTLALFTLLAWTFAGAGWEQALSRTVAVLVIACPCALGLATPTAVLTAVGRAARRGLLIRDAQALEALSQVNLLALDKTGTLTEGHPTLVSIELLEPEASPDADTILSLAAAVESQSEQPIARAVVHAAEERGLTLPKATGFEAEPGQGVTAQVEGQLVWLGSPSALREKGLWNDACSDHLQHLIERRQSPVFVCIDQRPVALFALHDRLRDGALQAVHELLEQDLAVRILSGDHPSVTAAVGMELGLTNVEGGLSPEGKAERVRSHQSRGLKVAMTGDGINDALALTQADVGIAMGGGADIALEAAEVTVLHDDPRQLPELFELSRRTMRTVRVNLTWAFAFNVIALPLAAGALAPWSGWAIPPHWAAAAMAGSSLFVVLNSLRLR